MDSLFDLLIWGLMIMFFFGTPLKKKKVGRNTQDLPGIPDPVDLPDLPEEPPREHRVEDFDLPEYAEPQYAEPKYIEPEYPEYVPQDAPPPQSRRPQVKVYGGLGEMLLDMQKVFGEMEAASRQESGRSEQNRRRRSDRRRETAPQAELSAVPEVRQKAAPVSQLAVTPAAEPIILAATESKDEPKVDLSVLGHDLQLSDLQAGLLWQEIWDKPVALRRGVRR